MIKQIEDSKNDFFRYIFKCKLIIKANIPCVMNTHEQKQLTQEQGSYIKLWNFCVRPHTSVNPHPPLRTTPCEKRVSLDSHQYGMFRFVCSAFRCVQI